MAEGPERGELVLELEVDGLPFEVWLMEGAAVGSHQMSP